MVGARCLDLRTGHPVGVGPAPAEIHNVESVSLDDDISSHLEFRVKLPEILLHVDFQVIGNKFEAEDEAEQLERHYEEIKRVREKEKAFKAKAEAEAEKKKEEERGAQTTSGKKSWIGCTNPSGIKSSPPPLVVDLDSLAEMVGAGIAVGEGGRLRRLSESQIDLRKYGEDTPSNTYSGRAWRIDSGHHDKTDVKTWERHLRTIADGIVTTDICQVKYTLEIYFIQDVMFYHPYFIARGHDEAYKPEVRAVRRSTDTGISRSPSLGLPKNTAVLFVAALSEYDQVLEEEESR
ncbi:hypothetical protein SeMB42_g00911 [Synchytrium endobioticum]|uniref:Uncharacterized protein n=1 Tax=Synchytrium endobioticum TaxID=286115 RepID=A0A507DNV7_9FUNG|nr:hypothetical protein SeMB42_g00911 [Synchytrium endobioticum]